MFSIFVIGGVIRLLPWVQLLEEHPLEESISEI